MRQKRVLDSRDSIVGTVANLYVDEDSRQLRFLDVLTSEFLGLERKHHLLPVEAVSEEDSGSITLGVDQKRLWRARCPSQTRMLGPTRSTSAPSANITATLSREARTSQDLP